MGNVYWINRWASTFIITCPCELILGNRWIVSHERYQWNGILVLSLTSLKKNKWKGMRNHQMQEILEAYEIPLEVRWDCKVGLSPNVGSGPCSWLLLGISSLSFPVTVSKPGGGNQGRLVAVIKSLLVVTWNGGRRDWWTVQERHTNDRDSEVGKKGTSLRSQERNRWKETSGSGSCLMESSYGSLGGGWCWFPVLMVLVSRTSWEKRSGNEESWM